MIKNIFITGVVGVISVLVGFGINELYLTDRTPVQPIEFSHEIHAGDNQIPCKYCHIYVERSKVAGVPNVKRCMGCHMVIKTESPEIKNSPRTGRTRSRYPGSRCTTSRTSSTSRTRGT